MNKKLLWFIPAVLLIPVLFVAYMVYDHVRGPLGGMVVVIDPGHGGEDPGSWGEFGQGVIIREDEYVFEVSCRLKKLVEELGGTAVLTTNDTKSDCVLDSRPQNEAMVADANEHFVLDGSLVNADREGLAKRTELANRVLRENFWRRIVFVSLHFDALGSDAFEGVHFIAPEGADRRIIELLEASFRDGKRIQKKDGEEYRPVVKSGDATSGTKRIYVLSPETNMVKERVLIELGNFSNGRDVWRIRDADVRQHYAELVTKALIGLNTLSLFEVRE